MLLATEEQYPLIPSLNVLRGPDKSYQWHLELCATMRCAMAQPDTVRPEALFAALRRRKHLVVPAEKSSASTRFARLHTLVSGSGRKKGNKGSPKAHSRAVSTLIRRLQNEIFKGADGLSLGEKTRWALRVEDKENNLIGRLDQPGIAAPSIARAPPS